MATEIKNTLFRFVSFRAPELTSEKDLKKRFVFRGDEITKGIFDDTITNGDPSLSKWVRLKSAADTFTNVLTVEELKELNDKLYIFSVWISKNRHSFKLTDLAQNISGISSLTTVQETSLWDNLFYQTVTQKDFYAKEILIQLLVANNTVKNYLANDFEFSKKLLTARVVLPKELFKEESTTSGSLIAKVAGSTQKTLPVPSIDLMKQINVSIADEANTSYKRLKSEIKSIEKIYNKKYTTDYDKAVTDHNKKVKPIMDQYYLDLEAERVQWCSTRPTDITYNEDDPCHQPALVKEPVLPEFIFSIHPQLDNTFLQENLSEESYNILAYLASKKYSRDAQINNRVNVDASLIEIFEDYNNLYNVIDDEIGNNNDVIIQNSGSDAPELVSVGGVIIPVEPTLLLNNFEYQLATTTFILNRIKATLKFVVPDFSWQIAYIDYTLGRSTGDFTATQTFHKRVENTITFTNLNLGELYIEGESEVQSFTATITFTNGCKKSFNVNPFNLQETFQGYLSGDCTGEIEDPDGPTNNQEAPFIPSGFGVKQIGIADYRKVEQSVQCYVEGEVAHIENVMAREYREKSTRRLRRSEITETQSNETESEKLTDTTSTSRFEMQSEVASVIQESKDFQANTNFHASWGSSQTAQFGLDAGVGFSTNNSKEESIRQAVTQSKEITERALDRVVSKVKQERIEKIIEEFEENNKHGFDNTKGNQHVVGVYRWVDKLYKNQIINYGKRLMFEFMIPEPARLHTLGLQAIKDKLPVLSVPEDPRKVENSFKMENYFELNELKLRYWAGKFNVEITPLPQNNVSIGKSLSGSYVGSIEHVEFFTITENITIPEGYKAVSGKIGLTATHDGNAGYQEVEATIGDKHYNIGTWNIGSTSSVLTFGNSYINSVPASVTYSNYFVGTVNFSVKCELTQATIEQWKMENFKAIIDAYEDALEKYNQRLAEQEAKGVQIKGTNPGFYRQIENTVLRKNCISYLINQSPTAKNTYGKGGLTRYSDFTTFEVNVNQQLDDYTAFVKFIEQAFEWEIMSYYFYPFYWGNRSNWHKLYQYDETNDPLFRSFMQSGMARVIVTVRPGFEEAVRHYFQTGQIWNGGEVPVIDDELYLSIVDELRTPEGLPEGKAWVTRIPTSLTILQANSVGLKVEKALPCDCEGVNEDTFEDPSAIPCDTNFELYENITLNGGNATGTSKIGGTVVGTQGENVKVLLKNIDGSVKDFTYISQDNGTWELDNLPAGKFELIIDANNDLKETEYKIVSGQKANAVELVDNDVQEFTLEVEKL